MRLAVGHPGPGSVWVVRVSLRVQVIKENVHLVWREQLCGGLHVAVTQAGVVRVRVLSVQHGCVGMHPAGLISRYIHLSLSLSLWRFQEAPFLIINQEN